MMVGLSWVKHALLISRLVYGDVTVMNFSAYEFGICRKDLGIGSVLVSVRSHSSIDV